MPKNHKILDINFKNQTFWNKKTSEFRQIKLWVVKSLAFPDFSFYLSQMILNVPLSLIYFLQLQIDYYPTSKICLCLELINTRHFWRQSLDLSSWCLLSSICYFSFTAGLTAKSVHDWSLNREKKLWCYNHMQYMTGNAFRRVR